MRIPELAMDKDFTAGSNVSAGHAQLSNDSLSASNNLVLPGAPGNRHEKGRNKPKRKTNRQRSKQSHTHLRNRTIDQKQPANSQRNNASDGENAMGYKLCFKCEEHESQRNQRQRGVASRQKIQREKREQDEDRAHNTGDDSSRMIEFNIERKASDREHEERDVRVHQPAKNALTQSGGQLFDGLVSEVKCTRRAVETMYGAPIELLE